MAPTVTSLRESERGLQLKIHMQFLGDKRALRKKHDVLVSGEDEEYWRNLWADWHKEDWEKLLERHALLLNDVANTVAIRNAQVKINDYYTI